VPWDQDVVLVTAEYSRANAMTVENVLKALLEANAYIELRSEFPDLAKVDVNAFVDPSVMNKLDASRVIDRLPGR
jgi:hypothetical protein